MRLGKGQIRTGKPPETILSCGIEAIIGAIYLDSGLKAATRFIIRRVWNEASRKTRLHTNSTNYKERIQKLFLERYRELPHYDILSQTGPAHKRHFTMAIRLKGRLIAKGEGLSKKEASQQAARQALRKMRFR